MRISAINTNAKTVFASKKKDKKEERLAKKEAQHPIQDTNKKRQSLTLIILACIEQILKQITINRFIQ